ncbi:T7SS effector LXG polymorphic toxin [Weissella oryzae]|uniref:T7SS effector LXG polymorphic toxin n=1 Tax=Weissella oryzae TaxID=1129792 RepID=UPI0009EEA8D8|nr:T7SS effector LXG polymorphic toxin [Weissella oryzae]
MGLRYISSDSNGMKRNLRKSLRQGKQVVQELNSGSQQLTNAVGGHELSGAAYTAGKGLFSDLIIPAIKNVAKALDNVERDLQKYEAQEHIVGGEALLDEDALLMERQIKRTLMEAAKTQANVYKATAKSVEHVPVLNMGTDMFKSHAKQMENVAHSYQAEIKKIEEKLKKLHQFSEGTQSLFENSLRELRAAMKSVNILNSSVVDNKTGKYKRFENTMAAKGVKQTNEAGELYKKGVKYGAVGVSGVEIARKWKRGAYKGRSGLSKARAKDVRLLKYSGLAKSKRLQTMVSKLPSYTHSQINNDLKIAKYGKQWGNLVKSKPFKIAGWVGTVANVGSDVVDLKAKGYSNTQTAELTAAHTAVNVTAAAAGKTIGTNVGAIVGGILFPGAGFAIGAVVGGLLGSLVGGYLANRVNTNVIDKNVKPGDK